MKIQVNAEATVRNFSAVMTDKTKLLSELLQNARRAGATLVEFYTSENEEGRVDLTVVDNGIGIADFAKLFTLSESGWNESLASAENSFGMGFFSVFFAADEVLVQSKGQSMLIDCALARSMADFGEPVVDHSCTDFTKITLRGVRMSIPTISGKLSALAEYSRIPVSFNGELLKRDYCFEALRLKAREVVATPYGTLVVMNEWSDSFKIIVQDLYVGEEYDYQRQFNFLFSDSLACRMPDRDKLLDEIEIRRNIKAVVLEHWQSKLAAIRTQLNDDVAFLDNHFDKVLRYSPSVLSDIDYLPASAFQKVHYPCQRSDYDTNSVEHDTGLRRGETSVSFRETVELWEAPLTANFVYLAKARIPQYGLPEDHWFFESCIEPNDEAFVVMCDGASMFDFELGYVGNGCAVVAEKVKIIHKPTGLEAVLDGDGFGLDTEGYYHPKSRPATFMLNGEEIETPTLVLNSSGDFCWGWDLLLQLSSYINSSDEWQDTCLEDDIVALERQFLVAVRGNVEDVLSELLGKLPPVLAQKLNGKELSVSIKDGQACFRLKAA